ncbi:hypothetical protein [Sporosarcina sp. FSL K6-5500]|uniref:hypothetical protein n=1 Tax=Sporosarcina sp. FSL K6-5500 TaxID=2921558 RepID=UPI0030FB6832
MSNDPNDRNHPNDSNGSWDYDSRPDIEEYHEKDGNLDQYDKDYDTWESNQN